MPRRPAKVKQADIARAIRAAKEAGASEVSVDGNGVICQSACKFGSDALLVQFRLFCAD
jgi:hypothetical protein